MSKTKTKTKQRFEHGKLGERGTFKIRGRGVAHAHRSKQPDELGSSWQQAIAPWIGVLYGLLLIAVLIVCIWNIAPYEVAVRIIASRFETSGLVELALKLPLLGWILQWIGRSLFWIVGALVWAVIQTIELMPIVMTSHPGYVRSVLTQLEAYERIRPKSDDPGIVRYLKKFYNRLPVRFLVLSRRLRGWIYALDMAIVMMVYPPVTEGGVGRFFFLLATGQWGQFDWLNIVLLFSTLLAVEAVFKILLIVHHFRKYLKASNTESQSVPATPERN